MCRWLPVTFVLCLIAWCYMVFTVDILVPMLQLPADPAEQDPEGAPGSHALGVAYTVAFNAIFTLHNTRRSD